MDPLKIDFLLKMVIVHCYVSLPGGTIKNGGTLKKMAVWLPGQYYFQLLLLLVSGYLPGKRRRWNAATWGLVASESNSLRIGIPQLPCWRPSREVGGWSRNWSHVFFRKKSVRMCLKEWGTWNSNGFQWVKWSTFMINGCFCRKKLVIVEKIWFILMFQPSSTCLSYTRFPRCIPRLAGVWEEALLCQWTSLRLGVPRVDVDVGGSSLSGGCRRQNNITPQKFNIYTKNDHNYLKGVTFSKPSFCVSRGVHSGKLTQLVGKWTRNESMYFLLKMGIFQPAMWSFTRG